MKLLRLLAAVAPLFAAGLWAADTSGNGITTPESLFPQLDTILKQAVTQSPRMVARAVDEEIAENDRITARAGLLPSIGGYYRFQETRDHRADQHGTLSVQKEYYDFSINQPVYYWGERRNNARIGEIRKSLVEGNVREAYRNLAQEIRNLYLRLIIDKVRANRATFYREFAVNQAKLGEERLAKKTVSEAQMFGIRMEAEKSYIAEERARFDLENDKASFARLTGSPVLSDEQIPDTIPPISDQKAALDALLAGYLSQNDKPTPEADSLRKNMEIDRLTLANAKTRLRPKFNVVAGINQDEQSYSINVANRYAVKSLYAGVSLSWTIFDGFAAGAAERNAFARARQNEREYRALNERLAQAAQNQVRLAGFSARYCSINDRYLTSAEGGLRGRQEEFSRGVISEADVSTARMGVFDSTLTAFSSRADYYDSVCDFLGIVVEDPVLANLKQQ